jgi:small subunit ribosomal protein S20
MASHKSAEKRARQALKRRERNRSVLTQTRSTVKGLRQALADGDKGLAAERLRAAERELRRAASKGVVPQTRVDRSVSRLARAVNRLD